MLAVVHEPVEQCLREFDGVVTAVTCKWKLAWEDRFVGPREQQDACTQLMR